MAAIHGRHVSNELKAMMHARHGRRGNAKSAGTHDMPIPGEVISRRVHKPKKAPQPQQESKKKLAAEAAIQAAFALRKQQRQAEKAERRRERGRERQRQEEERNQRENSRPRKASKESSSSKSSSSSSSEDDAKPRAKRENSEERKLRQAAEEKNMRKRQEEERRARREAEEKWRKQQQAMEARQAEDRQKAEEQRLKEEQRQAKRKHNLAGAFAFGDDDDGEDGQSQIEKKKPKFGNLTLAVSRSAFSPLSRLDPANLLVDGKPSGPMDAVALRASLADPSATRSFTSGDVAEQYKLLQEMKRKFRSKDFGGPTEVRARSPVRSSRRKRSRSNSKTRYDSIWIKRRKS